MERFLLAISFVVMGWIPFFLGIYLAYTEEYFTAIICFLVSFCGFKQVYDTLKYQSLYIAQQKELLRMRSIVEQHSKDIRRLYE